MYVYIREEVRTLWREGTVLKYLTTIQSDSRTLVPVTVLA